MEEQEIIQKAQELYFKYGIKRITMDDIAGAAGISKKTLYTHFDNKDALVKSCIVDYITHQKESIENIIDQDLNAIDELLSIYEHTCRKLRKINPGLVFDLQKFYTDSWQVFQEYKSSYIYNNVLDNLKKGVKEGLYRDDIELKLIATIYTARLDLMIDPEVFSPRHYSYNEIFRELFIYHIRGIGSQRGILHLENNINIEL